MIRRPVSKKIEITRCFRVWPLNFINLMLDECLFCLVVQYSLRKTEKCHRFWLCLRHAMILISKVRTSASKKIDLMALIRTPTISTTTFDGFRKTQYIQGVPKKLPNKLRITRDISGPEIWFIYFGKLKHVVKDVIHL